jgi:TIR domain
LGGEDFWLDIETAIRHETAKFLLVVSKSSNQKPGPLQELQVAKTVERVDNLVRFVVPLRVDDLPFSDFNIQIGRVNAIDFNPNWQAGLRQLLQLVDEDAVDKDPRFNSDSVNTWWEHESNWFRIRSLPARLYFHQAASTGNLDASVPRKRIGRFLLSFASRLDGVDHEAFSIPVEEFLEGIRLPMPVSRRGARSVVVELLRHAMDDFLFSSGMGRYELSRRRSAAYFVDELSAKNRVTRVGPGSRSTWRLVVGRRSRIGAGGVRRTTFWHFAVEAIPILHPFPAFRVVPHVAFSDDGHRLWSSSTRLHIARRSYCKDWWNSEWRDRIVGSMRWLAGGGELLHLSLGGGARAEVESSPVIFRSPVTYVEPGEAPSLLTLDDPEYGEEDFDEDA